MSMLWWLSAPIIGFLALRWYIRRTKQCPSHMRLDHHTVVITGASSGIGKATAFELAKRGGRIILACRDRAKTEPVVKKIVKETGNQNVEFRLLDLACQRSIRDFAREFMENEARLDILINNAAYEGPKSTTEDGLEMSLGVNHVGHFLLTRLLLPKLRMSSPSRIIVVSSDIYSKGHLDLNNLKNDGYPDIYMAYARSKLANIYFTSELHRRYSKDGVTSYAVHPGVTSTALYRVFPGLIGILLRSFGKFMFKSAEQGCQTVVFCAVARGIEKHSGKFFVECHTRELVQHVIDALNQGDGEKLWTISETMCQKYISPWEGTSENIQKKQDDKKMVDGRVMSVNKSGADINPFIETKGTADQRKVVGATGNGDKSEVKVEHEESEVVNEGKPSIPAISVTSNVEVRVDQENAVPPETCISNASEFDTVTDSDDLSEGEDDCEEGGGEIEKLAAKDSDIFNTEM